MYFPFYCIPDSVWTGYSLSSRAVYFTAGELQFKSFAALSRIESRLLALKCIGSRSSSGAKLSQLPLLQESL